MIVFFLRLFFLVEIGIEIAKVFLSSKNTDKSGTFATIYQTDKY